MLARETRVQMRRHLLLVQSEVSASLSTLRDGESAISMSLSVVVMLRFGCWGFFLIK